MGENSNIGNFNKDAMPERSIANISNICEKELLSPFFRFAAGNNKEKGLFFSALLSRLTQTSE